MRGRGRREVRQVGKPARRGGPGDERRGHPASDEHELSFPRPPVAAGAVAAPARHRALPEPCAALDSDLHVVQSLLDAEPAQVLRLHPMRPPDLPEAVKEPRKFVRGQPRRPAAACLGGVEEFPGTVQVFVGPSASGFNGAGESRPVWLCRRQWSGPPSVLHVKPSHVAGTGILIPMIHASAVNTLRCYCATRMMLPAVRAARQGFANRKPPDVIHLLPACVFCAN